MRRIAAMAAVLGAAVAAAMPAAMPSVALAMGGGDGCNPWNVSSDRQVNDYYTPRWVSQIQSDDSNFSGEVDEAKAAIKVYSPWVSQGLDDGTEQAYGGSDVSGWVMINEDPRTTSGETYFQAGWIEYYQGHRQNFAEMDVPGQPFAILWMQQDPINSVHWWDVKYNRGYVDPTTQPMYVVQEDSNQPLWVKPPTADYQFIPNQAQLSAETHATADQLPGGTNNHEWMGYLQITTERSGSLHIGSTDYFVNTWQEGGWYGQQTFGDNTMQMWDYACAN